MSEIKTETTFETNVYITVGGTSVPYKPMSFIKRGKIREGLEQEFRARNEPLDPPKIEVEVFGGDKLEKELSETNLEVEDNPEETASRKALWETHIDAVRRFDNELKDAESDLLMSAILIDLPEDESWIAEQKRLHICIPEDLEKRRQHYIQTEVLTSMEDILEINSLIFTKSAVRTISQEDLVAAKDSFRNYLFGAFEGSASKGTGTEEPEATTQEGRLDT